MLHYLWLDCARQVWQREREETQILRTWPLEVVIVSNGPGDLNRVIIVVERQEGFLKEERGLSSVNRVNSQQS